RRTASRLSAKRSVASSPKMLATIPLLLASVARSRPSLAVVATRMTWTLIQT
ncbi:hypothetical protein GGI09_008781, partial [Coemansia sp. S100]